MDPPPLCRTHEYAKERKREGEREREEKVASCLSKYKSGEEIFLPL
jgi:hypothetical protein